MLLCLCVKTTRGIAARIILIHAPSKINLLAFWMECRRETLLGRKHNVGRKYLHLSYLERNFMLCRGSASPLNSISDADNETINGVVTWILVFLYFISAKMVNMLKVTPATAMIIPNEPAKLACVSVNTKSVLFVHFPAFCNI